MQSWTNTNDVERTYQAVQMQGSYRIKDHLELGGHYTWSELRGNGGGGLFPQANVAGSYREYKAFAQHNPVGYLPEDRTHKARLWASYDHSLGALGTLNVSVLERYDSSAPYDTAASVRVTPFVTNPGCATPPAVVTYYFSNRGAYRWEHATATDLALNWDLPVAKVRLFVQGEILNVLDERAQVGAGTGVIVRSDRDPTTPGVQRFNPFTMQRSNVSRVVPRCATGRSRRPLASQRDRVRISSR